MMTTTENTAPLATCSECGKTCQAKPTKTGGIKTPRNWKLVNGELLCLPCKQAAYITRSVRVQIIGLAEGDENDTKDFRAALSAAGEASCRYANWYTQQLMRIDPALAPNTDGFPRTKLGKLSLPTLPAAEKNGYRPDLFPALAGVSITTLAQIVRKCYETDRFGAFVAHNRAVRSYRRGSLPIEIAKQGWSFRRDAHGNLCVRTQVQPGKAWMVKIAPDSIARTRIEQMMAGDAIPLSLKIVRATKYPVAGSTKPPYKTWFFRIGAMLPRPTRRNQLREVTLTLGHDAGALLFGSLEDSDDVFEFSGFTLRKLIVGGDIADRRRQSEQSQIGRLVSKRKRIRWATDRTAACENRRRKISEQIKLAASALAGWCLSHSVTSVDYDITDRGFIPHCPWRKLRDTIASVLEREGIALHVLDNESAAFVGPEGQTNVEL